MDLIVSGALIVVVNLVSESLRHELEYDVWQMHGAAHFFTRWVFLGPNADRLCFRVVTWWTELNMWAVWLSEREPLSLSHNVYSEPDQE